MTEVLVITMKVMSFRGKLLYRKCTFNICIHVIIIAQMRALTHDEIEGNCCFYAFRYTR